MWQHGAVHQCCRYDDKKTIGWSDVMKCAQPCAEHDAGYLSKQIIQEDKMMHVLLRIKV